MAFTAINFLLQLQKTASTPASQRLLASTPHAFVNLQERGKSYLIKQFREIRYLSAPKFNLDSFYSSFPSLLSSKQQRQRGEGGWMDESSVFPCSISRRARRIVAVENERKLGGLLLNLLMNQIRWEQFKCYTEQQKAKRRRSR